MHNSHRLEMKGESMRKRLEQIRMPAGRSYRAWFAGVKLNGRCSNPRRHKKPHLHPDNAIHITAFFERPFRDDFYCLSFCMRQVTDILSEEKQ